MADSATELGRIIGGIANEQSSIQENLSPDDVNAQLNTVNSETVVIEGVLVGTKKTLASDAFVLDHPVQGELDSSIYKLDGGYADTIIASQFPWTFPQAFDAVNVVGTEELFRINF